MNNKDDGSNSRAAAALVIADVLNGKPLDTALVSHGDRIGERDQGLVAELTHGVSRWHPRLQQQLNGLVERPLAKKLRNIEALLLVGLYQLQYTRIPAHAAISATVQAVMTLRQPKLKGLVNAVLRRAQREGLEADPDDPALPGWWLDRLKTDWPKDWQRLARAGNSRPPMVLRVNQRKQSRDVYLARLTEAEIAAEEIIPDTTAIELTSGTAVQSLPGWSEGDVAIQDGAAQYAAGLINAEPGQRLLDACAAPGGKTCHLLESCEDLKLVALDCDPQRVTRIHENLQRLGLKATLKTGDATQTNTWWDGESFDHILLDAPCSGSGVLRRHPDMKLLRRASDIPALVQLQNQLLNALWPLLKPGGQFLYATCSVFAAENDQQISKFLDQQADAKVQSIDLPAGRKTSNGWQILTGDGPPPNGHDGFFYALLKKQTIISGG